MLSAPQVVFIHGFAAMPEVWNRVIAALPENCKITNTTLVGHGHRREDSIFTIEHCAAQIIKELDNEYSSLILVGHSMGTRVALEIYNKITDFIQALVLVDGSNCPVDPQYACQQLLCDIKTHGYVQAMEKILKTFLLNNLDPDDYEKLIESAVNLPEKAALGYTKSMAKWDSEQFEQRVSDIAVPVYILQSTTINAGGNWRRAKINEDDNSLWLNKLKLLPNSKTLKFPDCGHFLMLEKPEEVALIIKASILS